jgi:ectoine hydroxylase-related dioxygenase (phytanoyl-CoA dioxygenase family)
MKTITKAQHETFWQDGAVLVENAVTPEELRALRADFSEWVAESRAHTAAYGEIMDGRPRFDLEPGHSAQTPALRRVASPTEISTAYENVSFNSRMADIVADLIGPNIRFHHSKVNSKLPGAKTVVKWHQDFPFDPHSNDDQITALLFVDDVTPENGPLQIVPGSHKGPLHSLWQNGIFTGAIDEHLTAEFENAAVPCCGPAGAVCLMHCRVTHASGLNQSSGPRSLFITTYTAADGVALSPVAVPSRHFGRMVRGTEPGRIRSTVFDIEVPEIPKGASFFVQQQGS